MKLKVDIVSIQEITRDHRSLFSSTNNDVHIPIVLVCISIHNIIFASQYNEYAWLDDMIVHPSSLTHGMHIFILCSTIRIALRRHLNQTDSTWDIHYTQSSLHRYQVHWLLLSDTKYFNARSVAVMLLRWTLTPVNTRRFQLHRQFHHYYHYN